MNGIVFEGAVVLSLLNVGLSRMRRGSRQGKINSVKRRLFIVVAAVSLLLSAMWVGSYRISFEIERTHRFHSASHFQCEADRLRIDDGIIYINRFITYAPKDIPDEESDLKTDGYYYSVARAYPADYSTVTYYPLGGWNWHGLGWQRRPMRFADGELQISQSIFSPLWFLAVLITIPIGIVFVARRRESRNRHLNNEPRCRNCDYDLRATPDRCPECGEVPKKPDRVSA